MDKSKNSSRTYWIVLVALLVAGNAWAEDDIPPFEPLVNFIFDVLRELWEILTVLVA